MQLFELSQSLLDELMLGARANARRRLHHNLHQSFADPCQRLLNAICSDSYIRPHRHSLDPKQECLLCLRGQVGLLTFDDAGNIASATVLGGSGPASRVGAEVPPGLWHTIVALTEGAVLIEIKAGPFNPAAAKELAPWAPEEGSDDAYEYLASLRANFANACGTVSPAAQPANV